MIAVTACLAVLLLVACTAASRTAPDSASATPGKANAWPTSERGQGLGLTGRLVFIDHSESGAARVTALDLATGELTALFVPPRNATLASAAVSPDGALIALAYAPPAAEGFAPYGFTDLYVMPAGGTGEPQPLLQKTAATESFYHPAWSADNRYVYYGHFVESESNGSFTTTYTVERVAYPGGNPEVLVEQAIWPRVSPDGSTLAYVGFVDPGGPNTLMAADALGQAARTVVPADAFTAIDAAVFSPDGESLVFSAAPAAPAAALSWLDRALGVQSASAHDLLSGLWRIPLAGGIPERLTPPAETDLYPAFSPDGTHIAFTSASGLFVMTADGGSVVKILDGPVTGALSWTEM